MQKLKSNACKLLVANHQVRLQKEQQQIKEEAFQDGDFAQKAHQYLSSPDVLENKMPVVEMENDKKLTCRESVNGNILT